VTRLTVEIENTGTRCSTIDSGILPNPPTGSLSERQRPRVETAAPNPSLLPTLTSSPVSITNSPSLQGVANHETPTLVPLTSNARTIGDRLPESSTTQHDGLPSLEQTIGPTFASSELSALLDAKINQLAQQMSARLGPASTASISQDGAFDMSSSIASSGPRIPTSTDPVASQTFPLGFLGSTEHIDRLEGLLERIERLYDRQELATSSTPPAQPLLSHVSSRSGAYSSRSAPSWRSLWSKSQGSGGSTPAAPDLTRVLSYDLFKPPISETTVRDTIHFTALSANGQKIALLTQRMFRIFQFKICETENTVHLVCTGHFANDGREFRYSGNVTEMKSQVPLPAERYKVGEFSCAAVSNDYLAIGCAGRMMLFTIEGEYAGRWVCDAVYEETTIFEKVKFSADGRTLVTLLRFGYDRTAKSKALIYSTENIQKDKLSRHIPNPPLLESPVLEWTWGLDTPTSVTFSGTGRTIAISTTSDAEGMAMIRLLKRVGTEWRNLGFQPVPVFAANDKFGDGLTGITL
jgi:hypothetical protein